MRKEKPLFRGVVRVAVDHPHGSLAARMVRSRARDFLLRLGEADVELSVLLTTDDQIRRLNRKFRKKNKPTDVLSFPAGEGPRLPGTRMFLGDLAISLDTARRRASEDGRSFGEELARYLAHGTLHLVGYDHERSAREAVVMAKKEAWLLGQPGMLADAQGVKTPRGREV